MQKNKMRARYYRTRKVTFCMVNDVPTRYEQWSPKGIVVGHRIREQAIFGWALTDNEDQFTKKDAWQKATRPSRMNIQINITKDAEIGEALSIIPHSLASTFRLVIDDLNHQLLKEIHADLAKS